MSALGADLPSPREQLRRAVALLDDLYGRPMLAPRYPPVDELVYTVLSQNTADVNTDRTFAALMARFPGLERCARRLRRRDRRGDRSRRSGPHQGSAHQRILEALSDGSGEPSLSALDAMDDAEAQAYLTRLPGVGPKTAACVLLFALGRPVMPVDTHVHRVAGRLGVIEPGVSAEQAHPLLTALTRPDGAAQVYAAHVGMVRHGRRICRARRPRCGECPLTGICPSAGLA